MELLIKTARNFSCTARPNLFHANEIMMGDKVTKKIKLISLAHLTIDYNDSTLVRWLDFDKLANNRNNKILKMSTEDFMEAVSNL
uniref:Uncharacterized protein n=1 Tax=Romanomermis culicivorax TaxID=13658 RepID=A0A915HL23_ROMCU